MSRGRPPAGPEIVTKTRGSEQAKQRVQIILQTISGELSVAQACATLSISEARFRELRDELIQAAVRELEPKPAGRPAQTPSEEAQRVAMLEAQVQHLKIELRAAQIREEIALVMPHLLQPRDPQHERRRRLAALDDAQKKLEDKSPGANPSTPNGSAKSGN